MTICDLDSSVPDWIIEYPETTQVFNELNIDTSCGGKSLRYICICQGSNPQEVLERLRQIVADSRGGKDGQDEPSMKNNQPGDSSHE